MDINAIGGVSPLKARQSSRGGKSAGAATRTARQRGGYAKSRGKRGAGGANVGGYNVQTRFKPSTRPMFPGSGGATTVTKPYSYSPDGKLQVNNQTQTQTQSQTLTQGTEDQVWVPGTEGTPGHWKTKTWKSGGGNVESFKQVWHRKEGKYTKGGQSARMSDEYAATLGLTSQHKDGKVIHKTFEDYVKYMKAANAWHKTKEGKQWEKDNLSSAAEKTHTKEIWVEGTEGKPGYWKTIKGTPSASTSTSTQTQTSTSTNK